MNQPRKTHSVFQIPLKENPCGSQLEQHYHCYHSGANEDWEQNYQRSRRLQSCKAPIRETNQLKGLDAFQGRAGEALLGEKAQKRPLACSSEVADLGPRKFSGCASCRDLSWQPGLPANAFSTWAGRKRPGCWGVGGGVHLLSLFSAAYLGDHAVSHTPLPS